jgi:hypothetical protein
MGQYDKNSRIVGLLNEGLHVYVDQRGYVAIHYYTAVQTDADYISRWTGGNVCKHKQIFDVSIYSRETLRALCSKVEALEDLGVDLKIDLRLVSGYCASVTRQERIMFAVEIQSHKELRSEPTHV